MTPLEYIQKTYGVPAKRGALIRYESSSGPITLRIRSANNAHLMCSPKDADPKDRRRIRLHPTWKITYLPKK